MVGMYDNYGETKVMRVEGNQDGQCQGERRHREPTRSVRCIYASFQTQKRYLPYYPDGSEVQLESLTAKHIAVEKRNQVKQPKTHRQNGRGKKHINHATYRENT